MKFNPGQLVVTRRVNDLIADNNEFSKRVFISIKRHLSGDWGDLSDEDKAVNELALQQEGRLFSVYKDGMPTIWIITEWDRSVTTVLFPDEY